MLRRLRAWGRGCALPHIKDNETLSTVTMPLPEKIYLVMQQHIGAPCQPVVQKGDHVDVGTLVGKAGGFVSADIHSGVSGTVAGIQSLMTPTGATAETVVIEPDGQQTIDPDLSPPTVRDRESFLQAVRNCGLVGLGGAGFPTAVKLAPKDPDAIDTLIINAAECEPYIVSDVREILENSDAVMSGIMATKRFLDIRRVIIAIERDKPEAMDLLFSLTKGDDELEVLPLPVRYPQGAEKVLIETATGRQVPNDGLPADIGVLVMNVTTAASIGKYLASGLPLMTKRLTVAGGAVDTPQNVQVVIGTPLADVLAFCGGFAQPPAKVLVGGPMMGVAMADLSYPTIKQNNAILALTARQVPSFEPQPCIRCGRCVASCPVRLSPIEISEAYEQKDVEQLGKLHAEVCMGCGVCSFVCPARRLLSPATTMARQYYLKEGKK